MSLPEEKPSRTQFRFDLSKIRQSHLYDEARAAERATVEFALIGLKSMLLVNGGALIATLTFLGNAEIETLRTTVLWGAFSAFVGGLSFALAATVFAYFAQACSGRSDHSGAEKIYFHIYGDHSETVSEHDLDESRYLLASKKFRMWGIVMAVMSAIAFSLGSGLGVWALSASKLSLAGT